MDKDFLNWLSETWCLKYVLSFLVKCPVFNSYALAVALEYGEEAWASGAFENQSCLTSKFILDILLSGLIFGCLTVVNISANFSGNS